MRPDRERRRIRGVLARTSFLALCALIAVFAIVLGSITPPALAAPPRGSPETYVVQSGDTLYEIAIRYHTTVAAIKQLNGLKSDALQVGQKLAIPGTDNGAPAPAASTSYVVQPGDTLQRIALRYGTTQRALQDLNGIPNPNLIITGQALAIPASDTLAKPGLTVDPQIARQGGTLLIQLAKPELESVAGTLNGVSLSFTRAAGYFYAFAGISRCAKLGATALNLTETDSGGQTATLTATVTIAATAFPVQNINVTGTTAALLDAKLIQREEAELAALVRPRTSTRLWSGVFHQPLTGIVSSIFGMRRSYNGGPVGACGHEGMDLAVAAGTPIYSDARGRVVFAGLTKVRGNLVVVDHGLGVYSAYYHQSEIDVKTGQMVEAGDLIGKVGTTGLSTGNHLHWSLFVNNEYVDPVEWTRRVMP